MIGQWGPSAWSSTCLEAPKPSQEMASDPAKAPLQTASSQRGESVYTQKSPSKGKAKSSK